MKQYVKNTAIGIAVFVFLSLAVAVGGLLRPGVQLLFLERLPMSDDLGSQIDDLDGYYRTLNQSNTDLWDAYTEVKIELIDLRKRVAVLERE